MYRIQEAHDYWNWIYFVILILVIPMNSPKVCMNLVTWICLAFSFNGVLLLGSILPENCFWRPGFSLESIGKLMTKGAHLELRRITFPVALLSTGCFIFDMINFPSPGICCLPFKRVP